MRFIQMISFICFTLLFSVCEGEPLSEILPSSSIAELQTALPNTPVTETEAEKEPIYRVMSAKEAKEKMDGDYILLDIRTEEEFRQERIDGAILIPDYEVAERAENELPDKDALILVYCRSGRRSALATNELVNQGYTNVYDFGGIIDWPYDTVSGN